MSAYHCDNPVLHSVLQLNCTCYKKYRIMSPTTGDLINHRDDDGILESSRFEQTRDLYQQEMMKSREIPSEFDILNNGNVKFVPDWDNWKRHIWSSRNFSGSNVGEFDMSVKYSENISGYQINETFVKRRKNIVTNNQGLCVSLPHNLKRGVTSLNNGAYIMFELDGKPKNIQFALMSLTIDNNRKDAARVFCNGSPIKEGEFHHGNHVIFTGNTFVASKQTSDGIGLGDVLIKLSRPEGIENVKIEFTNLDSKPHGGRLSISDILIK